MELSELLFIVAGLLTSWILFQKYLLFSKMAPGPYGLPFVGSIFHLMRNNAIEEFQKYKRKYGKVFSLSAGDFYITVVTDHRLIIENLKKDEFSGRPDFVRWQDRNLGKRNRGILVSDDPVWSEQRRFVLRGLRDFGFGKESMEGMLIHELHDLQNALRKDLGQPVKQASPVKYGLIGRKQLQSSLNFRTEIRKLLDSVIDEHFEKYEEGELRDFVDAYIQQIKQTSDSKSSFYSDEGKCNLYSVLLDMFTGINWRRIIRAVTLEPNLHELLTYSNLINVAGAETTSTTLQWAVLYLCHNPHVQKKAQEEIDNVIGRSRPPQRADKPKLVYLEAVLNEVHRMCSLVPHLCYDAHHDEDVWGDADTFRPERFLDEAGIKVIKHEALIPFSSGKRQCLGETLARDTLFVFLSGLLQAFTLEIDPESRNTDLKGSPTFISSPKPFKVIIKERL